MERRHYITCYFVAFSLSCLTFHMLCIYSLRLSIDYGLSYFLQMSIFAGSIGLYSLYLIHIALPSLLDKNNVFKKGLTVLFLIIFYFIMFYANYWIAEHVPIHFFVTKFSPEILSPKGNLLYFEKSPIQFFSIFIWVSCLYYLVILIEKYVDKQRQYLNTKRNLDQSKLSLLRMRMNPHFLFNELNNIHSLSILNDGRYHQYIDDSLDLANIILSESKHSSVALSTEINSIKKYIHLQELRYGHLIQINFEAPSLSKIYSIPQLSLMTLVENAVKHCDLNRTSDDYHVQIQLDIKNDTLNFITKNTYNLKSIEIKGVGLDQLRERLTLYYKTRYELQKEAINGIFHVQLTIQLNE